ncbi:MAG: hypothetical protein QOE61_1432 [Micromonosporaceae bacterium]|nr:hypothetical protein [Micromonosporaceae bacterium]
MTSPLSAEDFDDLHDFIKVQVAAGYAPMGEIVDDAVEVFAADTTADANALRDAALAVADRALSAHVADQASWPETTDCDRLDAAFAELDRAGIVARQHFSCCGTCGAHEIHDEMDQAEKAGTPARGYTFFHVQDTEHAVGGNLLYLSYGAVNRDKTASVAVGHEVVAMLGQHGLSPAWNGKHAHRIALPLTWQRRRT